MIDLDLQLPPNLDELDEMGLSLYAIYFEKPYDLEKAHTFMKIHLFSRGNIVETDTVIVFYQNVDFAKKCRIITDEDIYADLSDKRTKMNLHFKAYFSGNVVYVTRNF